jgi:hypothetical protein
MADGTQFPPRPDYQAVRATRLETAIRATPSNHTAEGCPAHLRREQECRRQRQHPEAKHHPARWSDRFHPLSHSDLLTDRGVTERTRTDLTGDHLTGVQAHPQPQVDTVAILDLGREPLRFLLNAQGR